MRTIAEPTGFLFKKTFITNLVLPVESFFAKLFKQLVQLIGDYIFETISNDNYWKFLMLKSWVLEIIKNKDF